MVESGVGTDVAAEAVNGLINPGGFSPIYWACDGLQALHAATGLPWWMTIVGTTFALRTALLPFAIKQMKFTGRVQEVQPKIQYLTAKMKEHTPGSELHNNYAIQLRDLIQKHDVNPLKMFMFPLIQAPVFITMFMSLRKLAENGPFVDGLANGGALWFQDLSVADPYYILPVLASGSFLLTVELGAEMPNVQQQNTMKNVMRGLAAVMLVATYSFPSSVFMYWITSNTFSLGQSMLFRLPAVKNALGFPPPPDPAAVAKAASVGAGPGAPDASAFQELKDAFNKQKDLRDEIKSRSADRKAKKDAPKPSPFDSDAPVDATVNTSVDDATLVNSVKDNVDSLGHDTVPRTAAEILASSTTATGAPVGAAAAAAGSTVSAKRAKTTRARHAPKRTVAKKRSYGRKRRK